jgi:acylphosphatase
MTEKVRLHAIVSGKVQAVRFRVFTLRTSTSFQITGWVRNRFNRSVELIAEGERSELKKFLEIIKIGPANSNVEKIEKEWQSATGEFNKFRIRMTR